MPTTTQNQLEQYRRQWDGHIYGQHIYTFVLFRGFWLPSTPPLAHAHVWARAFYWIECHEKRLSDLTQTKAAAATTTTTAQSLESDFGDGDGVWDREIVDQDTLLVLDVSISLCSICPHIVLHFISQHPEQQQTTNITTTLQTDNE